MTNGSDGLRSTQPGPTLLPELFLGSEILTFGHLTRADAGSTGVESAAEQGEKGRTSGWARATACFRRKRIDAGGIVQAGSKEGVKPGGELASGVIEPNRVLMTLPLP